MAFRKLQPAQTTQPSSGFKQLSPSLSPAPQEGDYLGKGAVDAAAWLGKGALGVGGAVVNAVADSTVRPIGDLTNTMVGGTAAGLQGTAGALSSLNPFDFQPQEFQERYKKGLTSSTPVGVNPYKSAADGNVDIDALLRDIGGGALKAGAGAFNLATLGKGSAAASLASRFLPNLVAGAAFGAGDALKEGKGADEILKSGLLSGGLQGLIAPVGKATEGVAKAFLSRIPQFTPKIKAELGEAGLKRVGELMYQNIDKIPRTASREAIGKALNPARGETYSIIDKLIETANKKGAGSVSIEDIMDGVKKSVISGKGAARAGMSLDEIPHAVSQLDNIQGFYRDLYQNAPLNISQAQQLKKNLRYKSNIGADSITSAKNQFKEGARANAQKFIEDQVESTLGKGAKNALKRANIDYNVLNKLTKTLKNKAPYSGYLTDVISGSASAAASLAKGDVGEAVKSAALAIGMKRLATSALPKVLFAKAVKHAPNKFIGALAKAFALQSAKGGK